MGKKFKLVAIVEVQDEEKLLAFDDKVTAEKAGPGSSRDPDVTLGKIVHDNVFAFDHFEDGFGEIGLAVAATNFREVSEEVAAAIVEKLTE